MLLATLALLCATQAPKRVLVYTVSAGFEHEVVKRERPELPSLVERTLVDYAKRRGWFEVVLSRDARDFTAENLARFDLVFFYTTGELPFAPENQRALLDFVKQGRAFAGAHCATDTFYELAEYGEMIGARFDGHPWHERVKIRVEDALHPATRHLGPSFEIVDEIYQFQLPYERSKLHVLLSLDVTDLDLARPEVHRADRDFANAWCKEYGQGRVFYTALGHRPEVWADERFLRHLEGGFAWAMRADVEKVLAPSELDVYRRYALENAGDPLHGYQVFRQPSGPMCARCHAVFGEGGKVGPELSDVAKKYPLDEILSSVLTPSARIADGYAAVTFELENGQFAFGQVKHEDANTVELYDSAGELKTLDKKTIVGRAASRLSIMPDGLAALITRQDFADLVAYLRTLRGAPK